MELWNRAQMRILSYGGRIKAALLCNTLRVVTSATVVTVAALALTPSDSALAGDSPIAADADVYFIWPKDGAVLKSGKFRVLFGLRNCGIAPAGVEMNNTGHHHLIINAELPSFDDEIPADRNYVHFGKGQTEAVLDLPSGTHTLQLLFADHYHVPHTRPVFSDKITVTIP